MNKALVACEVCGRTRGPWWRSPWNEDGYLAVRPPLCLRCGNAPVLKVLAALDLRDAACEAGLSGPFAFMAGGTA